MTTKVTGLIPMAHAADVQRSVEFYKLLVWNCTEA